MTTLWMQTHSGERPFPFDVREEEIKIEDIAHALANICRFGGHTKTFYSVAQHSCAAAMIAVARDYSDHVALACLLHDAAEAYLGDMIRPIKRHTSMEIYRAAEALVQKRIFERFGLRPDKEMRDIIFEIDEELIAVEAKFLCGADESWKLNLSAWGDDTYRYFSMMSTYTTKQAKERFLAQFKLLFG